LNGTSEAAWLLDVNALIALISPGHVHHERMHIWFGEHSQQGWATCPITENGAIRVLAQSILAVYRDRAFEVLALLKELKESEASNHRFWTDSVSLTDDALFRVEYILGPKLVTDAYLLGLAAKHGARLVSFDRSLPWQAIRNGTAKLIETPLLQ
jgi:toxin-antitoxin system PIN domain toxin